MASGDGCGYTLLATVRTDGVTATGIATPFNDADEDASLIPSFVQLVGSGNNGIVEVTGVPGRDIAYVAVGTYIKV